MADFIMTVGLPGCGKSTWAAEQKDVVICSSDAIRKEMYGDASVQDNPAAVFAKMEERSKAALKAGESVIYDATNIRRNRRVHFLKNVLKSIPCRKVCVLFVVPVEECKRRNVLRDRRVPDEVYGRMLRTYNVPGLYEGFDEIIPVWYQGEVNVEFLDEDLLSAFGQETHWHTATLGEHMKRAEEYAKAHGASERAVLAASIHDIGKFYTKAHKDTHGNFSENAHYYGHENYGAYLALTARAWERSQGIQDAFSDGDWIYVSQLVNWHMRPFESSWKTQNAKALREQKMLGEEMVSDIIAVHEADIHAD